VTARRLTGGGGIGFGGIGTLSSVTRDDGTAYTLRLGFGVRPRLILMWDLEGAWASRAGIATAGACASCPAAVGAMSRTPRFASIQRHRPPRDGLTGTGLAEQPDENPEAQGDHASTGQPTAGRFLGLPTGN
jgi:hypothetical protein